MRLLARPARRSIACGWSLIELTIILVVLSILCAILAPVIGNFVRNAKVVRCREDVQALACAMWMFIEDTGYQWFSSIGHAPGSPANHGVELLVGDGAIPAVGGGGGWGWAQPTDLCKVDFFANHLITNTPGGSAANAYKTPLQTGFSAEFSWRGPYMSAPILPDPWGSRYAANVKFLGPDAWTEDVAVLSAGPNNRINSPYAHDGLTPGDDDFLYILSANSRH